MVRISLHGLPSHLKNLHIVGSFDEDGDLRRAVVAAYNLDLARLDGETALGYHERLRRLISAAAE
jgi:hypothetical protein